MNWVTGAEDTGFGIGNLPYGVVQRRGEGTPPVPAVRIGDYALDLNQLAGSGLLDVPATTFDAPNLNRFLQLGRQWWTSVRRQLIELLSRDSSARERVASALIHLSEVCNLLPVVVGDYVDFYASLEHATNLGRLFRPGADPLMPNWRHLPVGYHGRAGTVVVGGTSIRRPLGQRSPAQVGGTPSFGPERQLDFELELGFITGPGGPRGRPISAAVAEEHIFGFVLVNDWSARELQRWEYQPLGPFLGKSFATSISPWIVTLDALNMRRSTGRRQDPQPLDYLRTDVPWALDIELEAALAPAGSRTETTVSRTNARGLYWNVAQQLAHATINGASVAAGDLFASGTISGERPGSYGSLIESTWGGRDALVLDDGDERTFLQDGDTVTIRGSAGALSFGEVKGSIEAPSAPAAAEFNLFRT